MSKAMCPICAKASVERHKPFCSARCAQRDLGRWLNQSYTIPAAEPPEDEEEGRGDSPHKNGYH